jgi:hypothetical protein
VIRDALQLMVDTLCTSLLCPGLRGGAILQGRRRGAPHAAVFAAAGLACERPYAVMRALAVAYEQASRETSIAH